VRGAGERGYVTLELVLGLAFLVLPVAMLVLALPTWFARQDLARLAAQQAARTAVVHRSGEAGLAAAREIAAGGGLGSGTDLEVAFAPSSSLVRGGVVVARATVRMPLALVPGLGEIGSFSWTATFAERADPYGSGP
jgi:hypothetical protein